jgi:hypothetical protein
MREKPQIVNICQSALGLAYIKSNLPLQKACADEFSVVQNKKGSEVFSSLGA